MPSFSADPFALLGLPQRFDLDPGAIQQAYLAKAALAHPDMAGDDEDIERHAAELNHARTVLSDPEQRARALLALLAQGAPVGDERTLPPGFLMEMMELRENLDSVRQDPAAVAAFTQTIQTRRTAAIHRVGELLAKAQSATDAQRAAVLRSIQVELNAWRYLERLLEQAFQDD